MTLSKTSPNAISLVYPSVGTILGGGSLKLDEVLTTGVYSVTYRAFSQLVNTKPYTVTCLFFPELQSTLRRQMLIRGITLHQLASPHIGVVTFYRAFKEGNYMYVVAEYSDPGHDLSTQIFQQCRYLGDNALIKDIFLQLIDAVEYIHSLGIYHRNLNPRRIVSFEDGFRIAIPDFWLATTHDFSNEFCVGSIWYMSPECEGGEFAPTGKYSPKLNDIWSLGIILLNIMTGRNPWKSATPDDPAFQAYLRNPSGFLPSILPIAPEVNDILVGMLNVHWEERSTLHEVRIAVEKIINFYSDDVILEGCMALRPRKFGITMHIYNEFLDAEMISYPAKSTLELPIADLASNSDVARSSSADSQTCIYTPSQIKSGAEIGHQSIHSTDSTLSVRTSFSNPHSSIETVDYGLYYTRHAISEDSMALVEWQ